MKTYSTLAIDELADSKRVDNWSVDHTPVNAESIREGSNEVLFSNPHSITWKIATM